MNIDELLKTYTLLGHFLKNSDKLTNSQKDIDEGSSKQQFLIKNEPSKIISKAFSSAFRPPIVYGKSLDVNRTRSFASLSPKIPTVTKLTKYDFLTIHLYELYKISYMSR